MTEIFTSSCYWLAADLAYLSIHRFLHVLSSHHARAEDLLSTPSSSSASLPIPCSSCNAAIDLLQADPATYTTCPAPYRPLHSTPLSQARPTSAAEARKADECASCSSLFHLRCLAKEWLSAEEREEQQRELSVSSSRLGAAEHLLPLRGSCPCPTCRSKSSSSSDDTAPAQQEGLWADVVRAAYRRREWLQSSRLRVRAALALKEEMAALDDAEGVEETERELATAWDLERVLLRGVGGGRKKRRRKVASAKGKANEEDLSEMEEDEDASEEEEEEESGELDLLQRLDRLVASPSRGKKTGAKSSTAATSRKASASVSPAKKVTSPRKRAVGTTADSKSKGKSVSPVKSAQAVKGKAKNATSKRAPARKTSPSPRASSSSDSPRKRTNTAKGKGRASPDLNAADLAEATEWIRGAIAETEADPDGNIPSAEGGVAPPAQAPSRPRARAKAAVKGTSAVKGKSRGQPVAAAAAAAGERTSGRQVEVIDLSE